MRHIASSPSTPKRNANMAAPTTDSGGMVSGNGTLSSVVPEWNGESVPLKDLASKRSVPCFARVVKGSYMNIGSSKFSLQRQHHDIYVHSVKMGVKVLAHSLRRMEVHGRRGYTRLYSVDQRLAIPISYQGWFELLSEDGKAARPISSVPELASLFPERCLVRENIKGYLSSEEGRFTFDKTKVIPAGEQLTLLGDLTLPSPTQNTKIRLLRCIDSKGDDVYLSFDQEGVFTPIAGETDFTGVFNIRDIVRRFRLPLTVKLAHGVRPRVDPSKFTGLVRLDWVYTEETAFLCPVEKNHVRLLPVPIDVHLQLVTASNHQEMCSSELYRSLQTKCARMISNYYNTLHLIVTLPDSIAKNHIKGGNLRASNIYSEPQKFHGENEGDPRKNRRSKSREDLLMAEIDDLYNYVREGGVPPKSKFQYDSDEESYWEEPAYEHIDDFRQRLKAIETGQKVSYPPQYRPADLHDLHHLDNHSTNPTVAPPGATAAYGPIWNSRSDSLDCIVSGQTTGSSSSADAKDRPPLPPRQPEIIPAATNRSRPSSEKSQQSSEEKLSSTEIPAVTQKSPGTSSRSSEESLQPQKRVIRSDSVPTVNISRILITSSTTQLSPAHKLGHSKSTATDLKGDWKERLRVYNSFQDRERELGSTFSLESGVHGNNLARDFKDSDVSSKTQASSGSSGRGKAKKRMQTLYL